MSTIKMSTARAAVDAASLVFMHSGFDNCLSTGNAALAWSQAPLGTAVLAWALSFVSGCRHLGYVSLNLAANLEAHRIEAGRHPEVGNHPPMISAAISGIQSAFESNSRNASRYARWQFRFLVTGAVLYVA